MNLLFTTLSLATFVAVSVRDVRNRRRPSMLAFLGTVLVAAASAAAVVTWASGLEPDMVRSTIVLAAGSALVWASFAIASTRCRES